MDTTILPPLPMSISGAIYHTALGMDAADRKRFLEQFFRGDAAGLSRMLRLLERSGESSAFFLDLDKHRGFLAHEIIGRQPEENLPADRPAVAEEPGSWIGPYRLISRIGKGGCGVVYEAEQEKPVRRLVAVKIIRLGMDTESVIARFEHERQALALMQHPNIAQVFDAGTTSSGRPYFVMERVSGEKITACCDREYLDIESRIRLFILVCHAIQHAHQKGVIHRDIKPSNVLVTISDNGPVPKVIDFGIAKAADSLSGEEWKGRTMMDQIMGTPAYMSPEQVDMSGIDVDTRSDVYSLGALLYELLCGKPPFDEKALTSAGISKMRRILIEQEPSAPSKVLTDASPDERKSIALLRHEEPARLVSHLRGDLDWIVAKAMAKDRSRRYQTVNALAADLERFLSNQPIVARPPSSLYLLGKYIRRNRVICIAGATVALSLLAGLGISTGMYLDKRAALREQERLARAAESAKRKEAWLHEQVQARANVSRVAVLLSEGNIEEADALFLQTPLESIEPSREAAAVFRSLGNWYAAYGRWREVARCHTLLNQANRLDNPVGILEGSDIIAIAPALLESGDDGAYESFRQELLDRYLPVQNSLQAEHLLKACLLTPADPVLMERLRETALVCAGVLPRDPQHVHFPEWEAFSLALYYCRVGKIDETLEWAERSLQYSDETGARIAATRCLTALARFQSGDREGAENDLREARRLMPKNWKAPFVVPKNPPDANGNSGNGTWHSWAVARILLREAENETHAR